MDDFGKSFNRMQNLVSGWFIFIALLSCGILSGIGFVVYKLLVYFGVM